MVDAIFPSSYEQQTIASFLDKKCGEIDSLIALQEEMIVELQAYKQSVITEAVTKGLDHNVKMKDSGVEWIGEIPQHWEVLRVKNISTMQGGDNLTSEKIMDSGEYVVYGGNGIRGYYHTYNCDGDFMLIGRGGALAGNIHHVNGKFWATNNAVISTIRHNFDVQYISYLFEFMNFNQYAFDRSAQPGLAVSKIQNLKTMAPPLSEQQAIVTYLDTKTSQIDSLIAIKQEKIAELNDYKKSIIYEYVTGKKKV